MTQRLSVLVKTLNEEAKLATCLEAVLAAVQEWGGEAEVIIADSRSTDGTLDIARRFPVGIVELALGETRGCGMGVELGYQHARFDFVLLLDGDMQLQPGFLAKAFDAMAADSRLAGIAGIVEDTVVRNKFDHHRMVKKAPLAVVDLPWLGGGGLYRKAAITDAGGYAGNRNLIAYEEAELGLRLRSRGWTLRRLPVPYVMHTGHGLTTFALMRRMWAGGRLKAGGVLLRGAFGKSWFVHVLRMQFHPLAILSLWGGGLSALLAGFPYVCLFVLVAVLAAFVLQALRRRSFGDAFFSLLMWHLSAIGIVQGLFGPYVQPLARINSCTLVPPRRLRANPGESPDDLAIQ